MSTVPMENKGNCIFYLVIRHFLSDKLKKNFKEENPSGFIMKLQCGEKIIMGKENMIKLYPIRGKTP